MINWGVIMIIFVLIAMLSISFIFSPAVDHYKIGEVEWSTAPPALTLDGLNLRVVTWKTYPKYNIALGIIGTLSLLGAGNVCRTMYTLKDSENDALQSKNRQA